MNDRDKTRKIIHIDMDAFFAAVEQRDFPQYRGKPIVVGGKPNSRGIVAAASYEARKFGIHSAMPASHAYRRCPHAIFVSPRFDAYKSASEAVHAIFRKYTSLVEPLSIDEAYLDVSDSKLRRGSATLLATDIRNEIRRKLRLTASAGISYNKMLAKLASEVNKPNGQFTITPDMAQEWLKQVPIGKFAGIGRATATKMADLNIRTGADLLAWELPQLERRFGKVGRWYFNMVRGIDDRPVTTHRERKSYGKERTFPQDLSDTAEMLQVLHQLTNQIFEHLTKKSLQAQTITLKAKYPNFQQVTRAHTAESPFKNAQEVHALLPALLAKTEAVKRTVRLLGISFAKISTLGEITPPKNEQQPLI